MALTCIVVFGLLVNKQYVEYSSEQTGTSLQRRAIEDIPFPAVTLCSSLYESARAKRDFGIRQSPFATTKPKEYEESPLTLYKLLITFDKDIVSGLWEYYLTLDKIIKRMRWIYDIQGLCKIGTVPCDIPYVKDWDRNLTIPNDKRKQVNELKVPAGKWVTRIMSDSSLGKNYMCHTLIPNANATVNFSEPGGNSIGITFSNQFKENIPIINIFIHDRYEHVTLPTYALDSMAMITYESEEYRKSVYSTKLQAIIKPRLIEMPESSELIPCSEDPMYSQTWCQIQYGWKQKINIMKKHYKEEFTCILPGIFTNTTNTLPICKNDEFMNGTLGFYNLMVRRSGGFDQPPLLTYPSIGIHKSSSQCMRRCSRYDYFLQVEGSNDFNAGLLE